jgi:hypothetical protein
MKRMSAFLGILLCGLFLETSVFAQGQAKPPMTNSDVVAMVKAGLSEDIILSAMDAQATNFDYSALALVDLKNNGVSAKIMDAMLAIAKKQKPAAAATGTAPAPAAPGQQLVGQPNTTPPAAGQPPKSNSGGGFFDRLNQAQKQVDGAVTQSQSTVKNVEGTANQVQSSFTGAKPAANGTTAPNGQPAPNAQPTPNAQAARNPQAAPNAQTRPGAQAPFATAQPNPRQAASPAQNQTDVQAQQSQRAAAAQERRQQALAAQKKLQDEMAACRDQALKIDPQLRSPEAQKSYQTCTQAAILANTQTNTQPAK